MEFSKPKYAKLTAPFKNDSLVWNQDFEKKWKQLSKKKQNNRACEDALNSLLLFWLNEFTGATLQLLYKPSNGLWGGEDIIAEDACGRVHLFELKKNKIDKNTVKQIQHYLLSHVFHDTESFKIAALKRSQIDLSFVSLYLAGLISNNGSDGIGYKYVEKQWKEFKHNEILETIGKTVNKNRYTNLELADRNWLLSKLFIKPYSTLSYDNFKSLSQNWFEEKVFEKIRSKQKSIDAYNVKKPILINRNFVYWLVAPELSPDAHKDILRLRSGGNDIRVLLIDIRRLEQNEAPELYIRFQKEDAAGRDDIEKRLLNFVDELKTNNEKLRWRGLKKLHISYYQTDQPSSRKNNGGNLISPKIISYPGGGEPEDFIKEYLS